MVQVNGMNKCKRFAKFNLLCNILSTLLIKYCMRFNFLLILIIVCFLFSCRTQRYIYAPSTPSIPYFQQKGDSKLSIIYSEGGNGTNNLNQQIIIPTKQRNNGVDLQAAYAITNHIAIMFNNYNRNETDTYGKIGNLYDTSTINYKRNIIELGVGYYLALNKRKTITYNIYGGVGLGKFSITENGIDKTLLPYNRYNTNNIIKYFIQNSFNFMSSEYVKLALGGRVLFVNYGSNNTSYTTSELEYFHLNKIENNTLLFFEPMLNMQLGIPQVNWIKIEGSIAFCSSPPTSYPASRGFNASVGLTIDVPKIFSKK